MQHSRKLERFIRYVCWTCCSITVSQEIKPVFDERREKQILGACRFSKLYMFVYCYQMNAKKSEKLKVNIATQRNI